MYQGTVQRIDPETKYCQHSSPLLDNECPGRWHAMLFNVRCSQSIVNVNCVGIMTNDDASSVCCGVETAIIYTEKGDLAEVNILVVREKPLGYNLLIGIDVIRALGGVKITPAGGVQLGRGKKSCAAISIEKPNFCTTFDHKESAWTVR